MNVGPPVSASAVWGRLSSWLSGAGSVPVGNAEDITGRHVLRKLCWTQSNERPAASLPPALATSRSKAFLRSRVPVKSSRPAVWDGGQNPSKGLEGGVRAGALWEEGGPGRGDRKARLRVGRAEGCRPALASRGGPGASQTLRAPQAGRFSSPSPFCTLGLGQTAFKSFI